MVSIIPLLDKKDEDVITYVPTKREQEVAMRVHPRIQQMLQAREPYLPGMKRALLNYEGISRQNPDDVRDETIVMPFARIFVEAKLAEEVKASMDYDFIPVADAKDNWKVELLKDVNDHVKRKIKWKAKKHQLLRLKNILGLGIARIGYRQTMRTLKVRDQEDDTGILHKYTSKEVPVYDDLFLDVISPLDFAIDPNATSLDDAMDCVHFHYENYAQFLETYLNDKRFKNVEKVKPGKGIIFDEQGNMRPVLGQQKETVGIWEYFGKNRDEWIVYAGGIQITPDDFPLPDDHKELPFVSWHNNPAFITSYVNYLYGTNRSPNSGKELAYQEAIVGHEQFWTKGDPETMRDLIELNTGFYRAKFRREKLTGEVIIATKGTFRFTEKNWRTGDQAPGAMGNFQAVNLAPPSGSPSTDGTMEKLFETMVLTTGVDPRNLSDNSPQMTATQAAIQKESAMKRIEQGLEYNQEHADVRLGTLIHKLIQQYYTKPEIVQLAGDEDKTDLAKFDDLIKDPQTGENIAGKRYRRIRSRSRWKTVKRKGKQHLQEDDNGVASFIASPEFIRTSDVEIAVASGNSIGQMRSLNLQQTQEAINLFVQLYQLTIPQAPGQQPTVSTDDLPNLKYAVTQYVKALGWNSDICIGQNDVNKDDKASQQLQAIQQLVANKPPVNTMPPRIPPGQMGMPGGMPQQMPQAQPGARPQPQQ